MNILAIIQARMSSSRLPGKVMSDVGGRPLLEHMLKRVKRSHSLDGILLATTTDSVDDVLAEWCDRQEIGCYRGSQHDVLDRYYQAAEQHQADVIIRLTADCPLIDPELVDRTVAVFLGQELAQEPAIPTKIILSPAAFALDFAANRLPPPWKRTLPIGLDVEACSFNALERAWREANQPYQREHVLPYLYEGLVFTESKSSHDSTWYVEEGSTPQGFKVALLNHSPDYGSLRWTVDTPADLEFVRQIFRHFDGRDDFSWLDILNLLEKEPELASINQDVRHKTAFDVDQRTDQG